MFRKVQGSFLLFLLLVLALAAVLVVSASGQSSARDAVTLASVTALAALSVYRHRRLPHTFGGDLASAVLVLLIGWGMPDHLTHVFGLSFAHLFVRTLDRDLARVVRNGVLHPAAYFTVVALARGGEALWRIDTLTNLAGFVFVAGLMHTLANSLAQHQRLQQQITYYATHDALTGLANRMLFTDRLAHALAHSRRHGRQAAVVFVDLDEFKDVNDRYGHVAGDRLLAAWAERLAGSVRATDTAARLGGDEFALVIPDVRDSGDARAAVERIRARLEEPFLIGDRSITVSASWGIALATAEATADQLLHDADTAMFRAKASVKARRPRGAGSAEGRLVDAGQVDAPGGARRAC